MTTQVVGSAHDYLRYQRRPLDEIFRPNSVAVVGATERSGSVGRTIFWNLMTNTFGGTVYPVNPTRRNVLGVKTYARVGDVPEPIDLAVIVTRAELVPEIVGECADMGVRGVIIISAGFKEVGEGGVALEQEILAIARQSNMRIIGPNCLGVMSPLTGLNATFARGMARPGSVGFVSQSGALCTAILDWSYAQNVGFSAFVSIGSMLDVNWGDLIYYLGDDPHTKSIVMYMETIGDARSFLSAAREVALTKPIIVIKPGRTQEAAKAAASHTGSLTGSDEVLATAFRRCGVLRVNEIAELFYIAEVLAKQPRPRGPKLTIVTNAGGPGVLATDALIANGGQLTGLTEETMAALDAILPPHWSHSNPVDILGDATPDIYTKAVEIVARDPQSDGLLVILSPQAMTEPTQTAERLRQAGPNLTHGKPILASWMGGADIAAGEAILNQAGIPTFDYPDTAARMFSYMWRYSTSLRSLYETPFLPAEATPDRERAATILNHVRAQGRAILTEHESKQVLMAYGIPTTPSYLAADADEAAAQAEQLGYPVVVKINSETITHKVDVGGVHLNLTDAAAVRHAFNVIQAAVPAADFQGVAVQPMVKTSGAYELIVGSSPDPQFGPVLLFGAGGSLVEVFQDRALGLPPLTTTLARRLMERTKIVEALRGVRGRRPVDMAALEALLVQFSYLVVEQPWIKEMDINPLLAGPDQLLALDARIILYPPDTNPHQLPRPAIRPYPVQYEGDWTSRQGLQVRFRPIRPEDEPLLVQFHTGLSEQSVYMRYFQALKLSQRIAHDRLIRMCHVDYDREMALVATYDNPQTREQEIVAAGRLSKAHNLNEAEFAITIADAYHRQGLGTEMLRRLVAIGQDEGLSRIVAYMFTDNVGMRRVSEQLGFQFSAEGNVLKAELIL